MEKLKVLEKKPVVIIYAVLLGMMIIGTFWDLQINVALNAPTNIIAVIISYCGFYPALLCLTASAALFAKILTVKKNDYVSWICLILNLYLAYSAAQTFVKLFRKATPAVKATGLILGFGLVAALCIYVFLKAEIRDVKTARRIALVIFFTGAVQLVLINKVVKTPWGRPRYRSIIVTEGMEYRPWYLPGLTQAARELIASGVAADEFKSFPSGHTGGAATLIGLVYLSKVIPSLRAHEKTLTVIAIVFPLLVVLGRIMAGAHFLTDVTMAIIITWTTFVIASKCLIKE